jgi:hypothetical protein
MMFGMSMSRYSAASLLLIVLCSALFSFWPGILMSDSSARWAAVLTIQGVLDIEWSLEQWLAPMMTIFMLPFGLNQSFIPYFTLLQVFYLLLSGLMWISYTSSKRPFWVPLVFMLPAVYIYIPFIVPDIWTLAAMIITIGILVGDQKPLKSPLIFLFFTSCIILFGFRQNSLILLPLILFLIAKKNPKNRWERQVLLLLLIGALLFISVIPKIVGFSQRTSSAAAPTWELVGMLRNAKESGLIIDEKYTLDGIADTDSAIAKHSFATIDTLLWGDGAAVPSGVILSHTGDLWQRWLGLIIEHPNLYLSMKVETYKCMLGLCDHYLQITVAPEEPSLFLEGKISGFRARGLLSRSVLELSYWLAHRLKLVYLPIFWLPIGLIIFLINRHLYNAFDWMLIFGVCIYLASFFIFNQAASFRYLLPVYVIFTAYQLRFLGCFLACDRSGEI